MTSVALITAVTLSPFFRPISSALRLVITEFDDIVAYLEA